MKMNKSVKALSLVFVSAAYLATTQASLAAGGHSQDPFSLTNPATTTLMKSDRTGDIQKDVVIMNVKQAYKDLIKVPPQSHFTFELEKLLKGNSNLYTLSCSCRYQQYLTGRTQDVGTILSYGANANEALRNNERNCVEQAFTVEADSLTRKSPDSQLSEDLWAKLGNVQSVSLHGCQSVPVKLTPEFLDTYRQKLAQDADNAARTIDEERTGSGSPFFVFRHAPDWLRVSLATLIGGFAWRARGGGYLSLPGTQLARFGFGFLPYVMISWIASDNQDQFLDGTIASAFGALPLAIGWSYLQDQGRGNLNAYGTAREGTSMVTNLTAAKYEEGAAMALRGSLQTMFAAAYMKARGYDSRYLQLGGLAMGPCYFASYEMTHAGQATKDNWNNADGNIKNPILEKLQLNEATARGEFCFGTAYGFALAQTLRNGKIAEATLHRSDLYTKTGDLLQTFIARVGETGLLPSAQRLQIPNAPDVRDHSPQDAFKN